jgi:hypothetical protein
MTVQNATDPRQPAGWTIWNAIEGFAFLCCAQPVVSEVS